MVPDAVSLWQAVCAQLKKKLSEDLYARWISVIRPISLRDGILELGVSNDFYLVWLEEHYLPLIRAAVAAAAASPLAIALRVDATLPAVSDTAEEDAAVSARARSAPPAGARRQAKGSTAMPLNPNLTFDRFVVGPSNSFAHAAALAVAQSPGRAYNPLLIYGGSGLGKTHLIQAIGHQVTSGSSRTVVAYVSSETFVNEFIDALLNKRLVDFRRRYRRADVLLIDDIHFLSGKEQMQEEFFHTFNALHDRHKQIILTCDRPASEIPGLTPRLVSRFEWGLVTQLERPDLETRIAILRKKAELMHVAVPDEAIAFIAEHIRSNIRRLEGALIRAASYVSLTGQRLDLRGLEHLLRDTLDGNAAETPTCEAIQRAVSEHYDLRFSDMTSKRRPAAVALPRQIAMYLCRTLTPNSLPAIGEVFGRSHATVLHACRMVNDRMRSDPQMRQSVTALRQKLGAD